MLNSTRFTHAVRARWLWIARKTKSAFAPRKQILSRSERRLCPKVILHGFLCAVLALVVAGQVAPAWCQSPTNLLTGPAFFRRLEDSSTIAWQGVPFGNALRNLGREHQLAVMLDRRVDPSREINLQGKLNVRDLFFNAARVYTEAYAQPQAIPRPAEPLGVTFYGPVVFVGSNNVARFLRTVAERRKDEIRELPATVRARLLRNAALSWPEAAEPRQLVEELLKEANLTAEGIALVPHDLWPANALPPLPWCDRLTLLLSQFDLAYTLSPDGRGITIRPVTTSDVELERRYPSGSSLDKTLADFKARVPEARVEAIDGQVVLRGRLEDHEAATGRTTSSGNTSNPLGKNEPAGVDLYTMNSSDVPLRAVLTNLQRNLKLTFKTDNAALQASGISLDQRISFRVERAPLDDLLTAILKPAGLTFRREEKQVEIVPAEK